MLLTRGVSTFAGFWERTSERFANHAYKHEWPTNAYVHAQCVTVIICYKKADFEATGGSRLLCWGRRGERGLVHTVCTHMKVSLVTCIQLHHIKITHLEPWFLLGTCKVATGRSRIFKRGLVYTWRGGGSVSQCNCTISHQLPTTFALRFISQSRNDLGTWFLYQSRP